VTARQRESPVQFAFPNLEKVAFETTRQLCLGEAQLGRHTPLIAMTASALAEDWSRSLAAGMDDYISKPVTTDAQVRCVDGWLQTPDRQNHREIATAAAQLKDV